jgi:hypothetical protein
MLKPSPQVCKNIITWNQNAQTKIGYQSYHKVTLSFTPYPLFQWYPQSKEILLNLSMKCWTQHLNAQGSSVIIVVVHVGAVKVYICSSSGGA